MMENINSNECGYFFYIFDQAIRTYSSMSFCDKPAIISIYIFIVRVFLIRVIYIFNLMQQCRKKSISFANIFKSIFFQVNI